MLHILRRHPFPVKAEFRHSLVLTYAFPTALLGPLHSGFRGDAMTLLFHLRLSGALLILLGLAHGGFDRYLDWRGDIQKLTPINRQIFVVHWFYIALALFLMGLYFCVFAGELLTPEPLTRGIFLTTTLVWAMRLFFQWFLFRGDSWRNDGFNHKIHCLLTAIWIYLLAVNSLALARVLR